jgi:hypothetical protein
MIVPLKRLLFIQHQNQILALQVKKFVACLLDIPTLFMKQLLQKITVIN